MRAFFLVSSKRRSRSFRSPSSLIQVSSFRANSANIIATMKAKAWTNDVEEKYTKWYQLVWNLKAHGNQASGKVLQLTGR